LQVRHTIPSEVIANCAQFTKSEWAKSYISEKGVFFWETGLFFVELLAYVVFSIELLAYLVVEEFFVESAKFP
jgi:hypothetical protein